MVSAQQQFKRALKNETLLPAATPLLSSVSNRYLADPNELRDNLVRQMVEPVSYLEMIERLADDGVEVFIEIGPQQVLTRLNGQILAQRQHVCLAVDEPKRTLAEHALRIQAQLECLGSEFTPHRVGPPSIRQPCTASVEHFDATTKRKQDMRSRARVMPQSNLTGKPAKLEEFDATQSRRRRTAASAQSKQLTTQPAAVAPAVATDGLEQFLIDFIVEHTGYPAEIIELDWDLEADLGIDSIKKAQLFGELRELFDFESTLDPEVTSKMTLDQFSTLRSILDLLKESGGKNEWLTDQSSTASSPEIELPSQGVAIESSDDSQSTGLESFLIDFVVEQTGYPAEIIELDAQFEADLGIDSIKKAQLFGELREHFDLQVDNSSRLSLADFLTLRDVLNTLGQMIDEKNNNGCTSPSPQPQPMNASQAVSVVDGLLPAPDTFTSNEEAVGHNGTANLRPQKSELSSTYTNGTHQDKLTGHELRSALYATADRIDHQESDSPTSTVVLQQRFSESQWQELEEIALDAEVCVPECGSLSVNESRSGV